MAKENKNLVVALDIGTSKVACLVAELAPDGGLEVLGMGSHESKGLKKGVVVNIEATVAAIQRALEEAELMADCKIASAFVGIAGSHIRSFNSTGMVAIKEREVTALDVERALDTARAVNIKTRHGVALRQLADPNQMIEVPGIGERSPRSMSRQTLAEVIEPRVEELYSLVQQVLRESGFEELLSSGVVLTGGSAVMHGMVELGEEIFHMPGRLGVPRYQGGVADVGRGPRYATPPGLLLEGASQVQQGKLSRQTGSVKAVLVRMREWFQRNF